MAWFVHYWDEVNNSQHEAEPCAMVRAIWSGGTLIFF
jgi:hypothetical protein